MPELSCINQLDADSPAAQTQPQTKIRKITQLHLSHVTKDLEKFFKRSERPQGYG